MGIVTIDLVRQAAPLSWLVSPVGFGSLVAILGIVFTGIPGRIILEVEPNWPGVRNSAVGGSIVTTTSGLNHPGRSGKVAFPPTDIAANTNPGDCVAKNKKKSDRKRKRETRL